MSKRVVGKGKSLIYQKNNKYNTNQKFTKKSRPKSSTNDQREK